MEYSAASVKFLLWFIELKETLKLEKDHSMEAVKKIVYEENIYQQKSQSRIVSEFGCIKKRIEAMPDALKEMMLYTDLNSAKQIALIAAMMTDRILFELVYEVYRNKIYMDESEWKDSDLNIFFSQKADQSDVVAGWTDATVKKLKQTYTRYLIEAGLLHKETATKKIVTKPYIEQELREVLISNNLENYLYALTGER